MFPIKKQIVTDEATGPVGMLIDYEDWQKIEQLLQDAAGETNSTAVDTSKEKAADSNKNRSDVASVTTVVKFTLSMLPEIPGIHREEAENKAKEAYVMTLLRHHDISAGRAAELLGINRWQLSDLMDVYDICPFAELTAQELQREVAETMMMLEANEK